MKIKRTLSIVLALLMLAGILPVMSAAQAAVPDVRPNRSGFDKLSTAKLDEPKSGSFVQADRAWVDQANLSRSLRLPGRTERAERIANAAVYEGAYPAGTFSPGDIAVINSLIDNNGLRWPKAPVNGSSVPDMWNWSVLWSKDTTGKRIIGLELWEEGLYGSINLSGLDKLKELWCIYNWRLTGVDVSGNKDLVELVVEASAITSLDVSNNKKLELLACATMLISSLDVSANTELVELFCAETLVSSLDVSNNTKLEYLGCMVNLLTSLNVSGNTELQALECYYNNISSLNVSNNTKLAFLDCDGNGLSTLNVTKNTALTGLDCRSNKLSSLNLSKCPDLQMLICHANQLDSLNVSKNTKLWRLMCAENKLTSLNVSKNTNLYTLACYDNKLTSLNVSKCTKLEELLCGSNQLTSLDLSKNAGLWALLCWDNKLTSLDVSKCKNLWILDFSYNYFTSVDNVTGLMKDSWYYYNPQRASNVSGSSIKLSPTSKTIDAGSSITLTAKLSPTSTAYDTWKSSKTSVATVDYDGRVTAKAPGKATITVTNSDSGKTATCVVTVKPRKPAFAKAEVVSATKAEITWGKVASATGYEVRRATSKNGTYKAVKTTTSINFTNKDLTPGKTYYYKVRAYKTIDGKRVYGGYSAIATVKPKPLQVTDVKAAKAKSGQARISWSKQANVSGYQVVRATSQNGTYKSVGTTSKLTFTNKNLTAGKTYYYKVRAYKTVNGKKVYGAYSDIKSVKV